jgi:hypothetical protein
MSLSGCDALVADRESSPSVLRVLQLIDRCQGKIFERNAARSIGRNQEAVGSQTKLSGASGSAGGVWQAIFIDPQPRLLCSQSFAKGARVVASSSEG